MKAKDTRKKIQKKRTPGGNKKAHKGNAPEACRLASRAGGVQHRAKITEPPTKKSSDAKGRAKKAVKETNGKRQNETRKREGKENGERQQGKGKKKGKEEEENGQGCPGGDFGFSANLGRFSTLAKARSRSCDSRNEFTYFREVANAKIACRQAQLELLPTSHNH